jgi:DNA-binding transcriptional MerR regulator
MLISQAAHLTGLSVHTIRFYERSGLLSKITRSSDGNREFTAENVEWLNLLSSLRDTGMPLKRMKYFADLYEHGDKTVFKRKQVLLEHSESLAHQKLALEKCAKLLARKLQLYEEILGEKQ